MAQQHGQPGAVIFLARLGIKFQNHNANRLHGTLRLHVGQCCRTLVGEDVYLLMLWSVTEPRGKVIKAQ